MNITTLPSRHAIAAVYKGMQLINVYAPPGTTKRNDREQFCNVELLCLLQADHKILIILGDLNCVLNPADTTGHFQPSRALKEIVSGLALQDTWNQNPSRPTYPYHSSNGASRMDRFYMSTDLQKQKTGIEIIPAAFTDHHAVALRITIDECDL
jgi:exonuclease III